MFAAELAFPFRCQSVFRRVRLVEELGGNKYRETGCGKHAPARLGRPPDYEIKRELGRGGMGVVYPARNTLMGRDEVLKVIGRQIM
jgi:serine/threonine protein kinase